MNNKNQYPVFWSEAIALRYTVQVKLCQCTLAEGQNRDWGRTYNFGMEEFLRAAPQQSIRKDWGQVGVWVWVWEGEGEVREGWDRGERKSEKKDEQCGKWNEMRTSWAEGATAQSDSLSGGRPVCHGCLRLMDTFSPCQGRLQRKVLPVGTVGRCEMCVWGLGSGRRNRLAQVETRARRITMIHS